MFDWLARLFDWFFQFVPQFVMVSPSEGAVRITHVPFIRSWTRTKGFGWYMYWPLFQEMELVNIKPQMLLIELSREVNGRSIESSWALQYWIQNPYKSLYECEDHEEILASHAMKVIGTYVEQGDRDWPLDEIVTEIRKSVSGIGLYLQQVFPLQFVHARAHKLFMDNVTEKVGRIVG